MLCVISVAQRFCHSISIANNTARLRHLASMVKMSIQILVAIVAISINGASGQSQCLTSTYVSCTEGSFRGRSNTIETRLLFSMNFTCHGTIVGWTVTGERIQGRTQYPELQIWRADPSRGSGYYYKPGQDIPVNPEGSACEIVNKTCGQIFQCRLRADYQVSVQPGDILGVELPQTTISGFHLYFISIPGTQDHYIYREQLQSSVDISSHLIRQLDDQLLISLEIEPVFPNTATDGSVTAMPTINDFPKTERMSTTTTEESSEETSTITESDTQQSTTDNTVKAPIGCQGTSTATVGIIAGVAIGGIITGALITVLVTLIIVLAIAKLTKKKQSTLTSLAMNRLSREEDKIKDVGTEMKKDVEEPVYSVVLPNPVASSDHQVDMNKNECYGTLRA